MRLQLSIFIFLLSSTIFVAEARNIIYSEADSVIYEAYVKQFTKERDKPFEEVLINTTKLFLGKPYVASTLEASENEGLVINLREFDCTTFVENCIALSLTIKSENPTFENYCQQLIRIRYRNGKIDGYTSRLHYTNDWIYENEKHSIIKNISSIMGGEQVEKEINFMTTHPQSYKHLKDNRKNIEKLERIENEINSRSNYIVIAKENIINIEKSIRNGDIIAFATSTKGLDYSHIGMAYWKAGNLYFIHASSRMKKIVIEEKTLSEYCKMSKSCTGISILRITDIR
ncbi:MAG: N-acetylmuramoyl-L-alanine amidase-like domain-containing protein [Dysgonomonas sp.]